MEKITTQETKKVKTCLRSYSKRRKDLSLKSTQLEAALQGKGNEKESADLLGSVGGRNRIYA